MSYSAACKIKKQKLYLLASNFGQCVMEGLKNAPRNSNNGSFTKQQKTDKLAQQKRAILELVNVADAKTTQVYILCLLYF